MPIINDDSAHGYAAAVKAPSTVAAATDPALVVRTVDLAPAASFSTPAAVTATGSAVALTSAIAIKGVWLQADTTNTTNLRVGDSSVTTTRGIQLTAGDKYFFECTNASAIYVIAESLSPKLNYEVR